jgi:transposase
MAERSLKKAIPHRENALFYKTMKGARVSALMSLTYTCELNKINPFDCLTELLRHDAELNPSPGDRMPLNYRETLARSMRLGAA